VKLLRNAVASLLIFFRNASSICMGRIPPMAITGVAEPVCVPGAIAAMSAERRM